VAAGVGVGSVDGVRSVCMVGVFVVDCVAVVGSVAAEATIVGLTAGVGPVGTTDRIARR